MRFRKRKTTMMRVPVEWHKLTTKLAKKYGYKHNTEFLDKDGVKIFQNADTINDTWIKFFTKRKK